MELIKIANHLIRFYCLFRIFYCFGSKFYLRNLLFEPFTLGIRPVGGKAIFCIMQLWSGASVNDRRFGLVFALVHSYYRWKSNLNLFLKKQNAPYNYNQLDIDKCLICMQI